MTFRILSSCGALLLFSSAAHAANPDIPLREIPRTGSPIVVDAQLDEAAWDKALRVSLDWETQPADNVPARVKTTALLMYTEDAFYAAFIAEDPEPEKIRARLTDRDRMFQDDFVGVVLDTFNDERRAFEFFVNPLGVQGDLFQDDVAQREDSSFNAIWDSAGRITDTGYVVEMAIPMHSLRFEKSEQPQVWGIDLVRTWPRDERHQFRAQRMDRDRNCYLCKISKYSGFAGADPGANLEISPTLTAVRSDTRDAAGQPWDEGEVDVEPGVDMKWGITPNVIANLTLNPDFSQVEADSAQLDVNNQFALFFNERRPFFLEGQDLFDDMFDVVYTRNVADPDWGAKVSGKEGSHGFGVFTTDDQVTNLIFPGSQGSSFESFEFESENAAARYRYDVGEDALVGAIATRRSGAGYRNSVNGVDGQWRFTPSDRLKAEVLTSTTEYNDEIVASQGGSVDAFSDTAAVIDYNHNTRNNFIYSNYRNVGQDFRADLGFLPQVGFEKFVAGGGYRWLGEEEDWYRRLQLNGDFDVTYEDGSGRELEREFEMYASMQSGMQSFLELGVIRRMQYFEGVEYDQTLLQSYSEIKPNKTVAMGMFIRGGDAIDYANSRAGRQFLVDPWFNFRIGRQLFIDFDPTFERLNVAGGRLYTARLHEIRATWQFNTRTYVRVISQYSNVTRNTALYIDAVDAQSEDWANQVLFSYKLNPRTVFFAGYSDGHMSVNSADLAKVDRTIFLKFSYAWQL